MRLTRTRPAVAVALAALGVGAAAPAIIQAKSPATKRIVFQETRPQITVEDVEPKSDSGDILSQGDRIVTSGPLYTKSHRQLGTIGTDCTGIGASKPLFQAQLLCTVTYRVAGGQIVASGFYKLDGSQKMPIVGGSGKYSGARGTLAAGKPAKGFDDADVLTLRR
jgi:hypothetical protein